MRGGGQGQRRTGRSATMADVARLAGVSVATVSRSLSGTRAVDPAIRERVVAAADKLGYRVNLVGRTLRQTRSSTVGLLVPDLENPFFAALAQHLARAFSAPGIDLLVSSADSSIDHESRGVHSFLGRQVDALVMVPVHEELSATSVRLAASSVHTIQLDRRAPGTDAGYVGVSNRHGMALVADHVAESVDTSRQPVVFVGAEPTSSTAHERLDAVRQSFGAGVPTLLGDFSAGWGRTAARQLLDGGFSAATVVTAADVIAVGLVGELLRAGRRVPEDVRVVGFDGLGVSAFAHPSLTTVRQPVEEMARTIRKLVVADDPHRSTWLDPTLVLGETSPGRGG